MSEITNAFVIVAEYVNYHMADLVLDGATIRVVSPGGASDDAIQIIERLGYCQRDGPRYKAVDGLYPEHDTLRSEYNAMMRLWGEFKVKMDREYKRRAAHASKNQTITMPGGGKIPMPFIEIYGPLDHETGKIITDNIKRIKDFARASFDHRWLKHELRRRDWTWQNVASDEFPPSALSR